MKEINFEQIGKKLKEIRISKGLTQEYIANMADVNTSHMQFAPSGGRKCVFQRPLCGAERPLVFS